MELEDDLFFADIIKQISLLIMDDDNDEGHVAICPSVSLQVLNNIQPLISCRSIYYQLLQSGNNNQITAPSQFMYEQNCRRESCKGTGVFIPKSSQPRRKHRRRYSQSHIIGIIIREWFLIYHTTILLSPRKAKLRPSTYPPNEMYDSIISTSNLIANKGFEQGCMTDRLNDSITQLFLNYLLGIN